ncbi:hypothetical protein PGB90_007212 [Kerria lacca]
MNNSENEEINFKKDKSGNGINITLFYGLVSRDRPSNYISDSIKPLEASPKFKKLFGPTNLWKIFRKQQDVIEFISTKNNSGLLPFTYQVENGDRLFLAAHPVAFWYIDEQRNAEHRHSYEIIQEFTPCKLYFDLEFDRVINLNRDGYIMTKIFIDVVCTALKNKYSIVCDENNILNLDSSSETKFSCHLIFQNVDFVSNYDAGHFVKQLCNEIKFFQTNSNSDLLKNAGCINSIESLFILDSKNKQKLFCDEGVYTKNRHFRLYKSSKFGKNVSLKISKYNSFKIHGNDDVSKEEFLFLRSLITYYDKEPGNLLSFKSNVNDLPEYYEKRNTHSMVKSILSPYPDIDKCISEIILPGVIYRCNYFPEKKIIVYDIIGNRYCNNIRREHKSNNVMYVVNVTELTYYQKCYDPDCVKFKSKKKLLPINENIFLNYDIDDELLLSAVKQFESSTAKQTKPLSLNDAQIEFSVDTVHVKTTNERVFYDNNIDDENLLVISEQCESYIRGSSTSYPTISSNKLKTDACATNFFNSAKYESPIEIDSISLIDDEDQLISSVTEYCESLMNHDKNSVNNQNNFIFKSKNKSSVKNNKSSVYTEESINIKNNLKDEFLFSDDINDAIMISVADKFEL